MVGGAHPTIQRRSAPALFTFATVFVIVEEVLVVVLVVAVDGHANQPDQRTDVERSFLLARGVFGTAADGATAKDRRSRQLISKRRTSMSGPSNVETQMRIQPAVFHEVGRVNGS